MRLIIISVMSVMLSACSFTQGASHPDISNQEASSSSVASPTIEYPTWGGLELLSVKTPPPLNTNIVLSFHSRADVESISTFFYCGSKLIRKDAIRNFTVDGDGLYWEYNYPMEGMDASCTEVRFAFVPNICPPYAPPSQCIEEWRAGTVFKYY